MIILRSERGETYNLLTKPKHVVGRSGNLELDGDRSVSRQHAVIYISAKDKKLQIKLQDLGSKYGTFINENKNEIAKNTLTTLKIGDKIKFGQQWNTWTIEESKLMICVSMLTPNQKEFLTKLLVSINGIVVSEWTDNCSYLTMNEVQITVKVIQALGRVKPIVSIEYWTILADVLKSTNEELLPDCDDYVPLLVEPSLKNTPTDLRMNNGRRKLFSKMKFVACTTSQYNQVLSMVSHAGGTVVDGTRTAFKAEDFKKDNIVVMKSDTCNKRNRNLNQLFKILQTLKHRCISESEIGLSLIFISTEIHCNPTHEPEFVCGQTESQVVIKDEGSILDLETQDLDEENSTQFFDTGSSQFTLAVNDKRTLSDEEDDEKDVQIIHDTPEDEEPAAEPPPTKRKRNDFTESSTSKNTKMADWVIRKPSMKTNLPEESPSQIVKNKKPTNNLFAFNREKKSGEKCSDSLFKTTNSSTSSLNKPDSLEKRKRSSVDLFSRENSAPPSKKVNVGKKDLFQVPSTSKTTRAGSLILFESDSVDSSLPEPSKLKNFSETANKENSPTFAPEEAPFPQFAELSKKKFKKEIREESDDMTFDTKDVLNQSVILTIPLVKPNTQQRQVLNTTNDSAVNFKKFRKNNRVNCTRVISTNELVAYTNKINLNGDAQSNYNSDSD